MALRRAFFVRYYTSFVAASNLGQKTFSRKVAAPPRLKKNFSLFPIPYSLFPILYLHSIRYIPPITSTLNFIPTGRVQFSFLLPMISLSRKCQTQYRQGETNER